ncbi:hypothetical protein C8Q79DRAFT_1010129 [Trametes meyenii]|nr:hypothetical protein C8Q79DRAFT_1010129 [Trametes meyenii]
MDAVGPLANAHTSTASFIRVISLSIAFYDYVLTLPAEWRFYRSQRSWRLSLGCILFIAIRYSSIAVITLSNVGYFGNFWTQAECTRYYIAAPIFKVIQSMVSQLILGIRTVNISRRCRWVTWFVAVAFLLITSAQWFLNLWNRVPVQGRHNNCTAGNRPPVLTVWLYYLLSMTYDILTLGISSAYLISFNPKSGKMAHLVRIMLSDGLVYFVALTGVNIFNLILYRRPDESMQSSGVSLGYALTWIMSQRILIHLRDAAAAHNRSITTQVVVSRPLPSARSIAQAMRSQFESKDGHRYRSRQHTVAALSSGFDLDLDPDADADFDWSLTSDSPSRRREVEMEDVERSVRAVPVVQRGRRSRCTCDCEWASVSGTGGHGHGHSHVSSRSDVGTGSSSGSGSGVGPVASATLGSDHDRGREGEEGDEDEDERGGSGRKSHPDAEDEDDEKDVRVQIEETVTVEVEYDAAAYDRESYRTPRVLWELRPDPAARSAKSVRSSRSARGEDAVT